MSRYIKSFLQFILFQQPKNIKLLPLLISKIIQSNTIKYEYKKYQNIKL